MAETAVSLAGKHALPKILEAIKMVRDLPKEVRDITDELERFQDFINDADKVAEAEQDDGRRHRIKERVMRLREAAFRMEDVIDEYNISCEDKQPDDPRCAALLCEAVDFIKTQILRLQSAYKIQDVKSLVRAERDGFQSHFPLEPRLTSSRGNQDVTWKKLRMDPLFIEENDVVGLDGPRDTLKNWLTKGREKRTVISVVGIPGVRNNFDYYALITVSQSYSAEGLLRRLLDELCKVKKEDPPKGVSNMESLTEEVRNRLRNKRYVVLFDDVWNETFWDHIESAVIDNKNGSRILITTRDVKVAGYCKKSSFVEVLKLEEPLTEEESLKLFSKKAFQYSSDGDCPEELKDMSLEIVRKCKGLPLAIVAIGCLLSQKDESAPEWKQFSENLCLDQLERNSELNSITKILGLSYDDLPINLRSCLLYFGMYPEDYEIKSDRLIRQWIAEGFVKHETGKTLEEVGQQYLSGLVRRSLVQVSSFKIHGKVNRCRVHDLIHDMILRKVKDTGFCQYIDGRDQSVSSKIVRRLTIATHDFSGSTGSSPIRSFFISTGEDEVSQHLVNKIPTNYLLLKVLDFEGFGLRYVPENLGNLCHLKYLSFRFTGIKSLPKSIGKLQNLETLDIRDTSVYKMPEEIRKLTKLRHLLSYYMGLIQLKDIGGMTSLQEIPPVIIEDDGVVVIREVGKLKQLRELWVVQLSGKHEKTLCSVINEMPHLEKLRIRTADESEVIDLYITSPMSTLRKLDLSGTLTRFPNWISQFPNLVHLHLWGSRLTNDALNSLKNMPRLLFLDLSYNAYEGETLHFQCGGFQKKKKKTQRNITS
uniref:Disease resistance protein RPM1 n=2 Tax=Glycine subgen. Soja TaxID=1462606 RepID=A0A0R0F6M1_SOYBN